MRRIFGIFLATHPLPHGELKRLAEALETTTRTLWNWRDREGRSGSPGQPPHSEEAREQARLHVQRVWPSLPRGHDGWRSVRAVLERERIRVPVRLIRDCVRELKLQRRERTALRIEVRRMHVEVLARDVLWGLDQTHLDRDEKGETKALLVRDGFVPHTLGLSVGRPATGTDVVRLLQHVAKERGTWPFVIQADNGSENKNAEVETLLRAERVIMLWNEPATPEHNSRTERTIGSLKRASCLDDLSARGAECSQGHESLREPVVLATRVGLCARLLDAWAALDARTPRAALDGLTPAELDKIAPRADDLASRDRFYADACEALRRAALAPQNARARRKAEREAIWSALQRHGLVTRTRGGCLVPTAKAEGIS